MIEIQLQGRQVFTPHVLRVKVLPSFILLSGEHFLTEQCISLSPQVLLSLPCIKPQDLVAFEEALTKTASPKEQKQHMKSLLLLATGNMLKALAAQKSVNIITNVTSELSNKFWILNSSFTPGMRSLPPVLICYMYLCCGICLHGNYFSSPAWSFEQYYNLLFWCLLLSL